MGQVLVTGATGNVGSKAVTALMEAGVRPVVAVRDREKGRRRFAAGADVREFDFARPETWNNVLRGVDRMLLIRPPEVTDVHGQLIPFLERAREQGVKHVVFLSLQGVTFNRRTPHYAVERYLRRSGMDWTFLRAGFFMQNLLGPYRKDIAERSELFIPAGSGRIAFIDARDVGRIASICLLDSRHRKRAYTLTGVRSLDYHQVAGIMSRVLGRQIRYSRPTLRAYLGELEGRGAPAEYLSVMRMLYLMVRLGISSGIRSDSERLLGRPPTSLNRFVQDYAEAWGTE